MQQYWETDFCGGNIANSLGIWKHSLLGNWSGESSGEKRVHCYDPKLLERITFPKRYIVLLRELLHCGGGSGSGGWNVCFSWPQIISPLLLIHLPHFTDESEGKHHRIHWPLSDFSRNYYQQQDFPFLMSPSRWMFPVDFSWCSPFKIASLSFRYMNWLGLRPSLFVWPGDP